MSLALVVVRVERGLHGARGGEGGRWIMSTDRRDRASMAAVFSRRIAQMSNEQTSEDAASALSPPADPWAATWRPLPRVFRTALPTLPYPPGSTEAEPPTDEAPDTLPAA